MSLLDRNTFEVVEALEGYIRPLGEHNLDVVRLNNLKNWCDLHSRITGRLLDCANDDMLLPYASAKEIITYARNYLRDIHDEIEEEMRRWNNE